VNAELFQSSEIGADHSQLVPGLDESLETAAATAELHRDWLAQLINSEKIYSRRNCQDRLGRVLSIPLF
jgi:hypothetical protein